MTNVRRMSEWSLFGGRFVMESIESQKQQAQSTADWKDEQSKDALAEPLQVRLVILRIDLG
jgi:hypothetical protein